MEGFELFQGGRGRRRIERGPTVTLTKRGAITLNGPAVDLFGDNLKAYVQFLYNPTKRTVALRPAEEDDPYAYKLRENPRSTTRTVGAARFFEYYGIEIAEARTIPAYALDGLVAFDLDAPTDQNASGEQTGSGERPARRRRRADQA